MNKVFIDIDVGIFSMTVVNLPPNAITSGSKYYIWLRFNFHESWEGMSKTVILSKLDVPSVNDILNGLEYQVPAKFMEERGRFSVSITASDRRTTVPVYLDVIQSGFVNIEPSEPSVEDNENNKEEVINLVRDVFT